MTEIEEIKTAIIEASKGKRKRRPVKKILENIDSYAENLRERLINETWRPAIHKTTELTEGSHNKKREIVKPKFYEQIVHHLIVRQLRPIVEKGMYEHSFGSLPAKLAEQNKKGKAALHGMRLMRHWVNGYNGRKFYVAECDVKGFYDNINIEILKEMLAKRIRDKRFLRLLDLVLGEFNGLAKGFYTSPWLAHLYLMEIDHYIVQSLKPDHYMRYMDNLYLLHTNKKRLHGIVINISRNLGRVELRFNKHLQIYRFEYPPKRRSRLKPRGRAINCLGYVIHHNRVTLRKSILKRTRAKANKIEKKGKLTVYDARSIVSRMGWIKHADTYNWYKKYIKPKVSIQECKRKISRFDRRRQYERLADSSRQQSGNAA